MKKQFIFLNAASVFLILITFIIIVVNGNEYTVHTNAFFENVTQKNFQIEFSDNGIVELENYSFAEDGEMIFRIRAVKKGFTTAVAHFGKNSVSHRTSFYVTPLKTIIEKTSANQYNFTSYEYVIIAVLLILLLTESVMIYSFFDCKKEADFSYPMVTYGGIAMYNAILFAFILYKTLNNVVLNFSAVLANIKTTGEYFILAMTPIMLIMAVSVSISNIWLMKHEGYRPVNGLGILISIFWIGGTLFVFFFRGMHLFPQSEIMIVVGSIFNISVIYVMCYFECLIVSTSVCAFLASKHRPKSVMDYILILGCGIRDDGTLTPLLRGRVDSALHFEREQYEKSGKHAVFVPSGGQGSDEIISEGEAMERYLLEQGVPEERILREDKSTNTYQNFNCSYNIIKEHTADFEKKHIAFATTNYHIFRGYILSVKNGKKALGISAPTKWYFFPNAFLREFAGLVVDQKYRHIGFILMIILFVMFV